MVRSQGRNGRYASNPNHSFGVDALDKAIRSSPGRFECRAVDSMVNPMAAAMLARISQLKWMPLKVLLRLVMLFKY
ncbi:MAG: hypothetical protein F6K11_33975 [Leptolyngbya sp. SIO3F4]|nr:hypothetical protein [Leptolyngbya sp. SIO3F4]